MSDQKDFQDCVKYFKQGAECKIVLKKRFLAMFENIKSLLILTKRLMRSQIQKKK